MLNCGQVQDKTEAGCVQEMTVIIMVVISCLGLTISCILPCLLLIIN